MGTTLNFNREKVNFFGNINVSEKTVDQALLLSDNKNPYALEVKGDILSARGNKTEAIKMWEAAKKLGSNRNSLLQKLNQ